MNDLIERIEREIKADHYYDQNFSNDGQRFLAWYLRNVYLRSPIQARDDITDGADDKQIDAVVIDDDTRRVVVIQGKFYSAQLVDGEPLREVLSAWLQIKNLPALQESCNARLRVKLEAVAEALLDDYELDFELVLPGELTDAAKADLLSFQETISSFEHPETTITLVDGSTLKARWDDAVSQELPKLSHTFTLTPGQYLALEVAQYKTVIAAVPLADCLQLPGIREGTLFRKNVRQSLGLTNRVNKGLKQTIGSDNPQHFFLFHNGITALCESLRLDADTRKLHLDGLSVVNGCQSLTTILSCSEKVKGAPEAMVLFRFYEIPQRDLADKISLYTNAQSAVKPRDLRSNDKRVLALKRVYENSYRDGYFITKRGEERPADRDEQKTVDIVPLARALMAWHCQRPNISSNENKLFDKYFETIFRADYDPADVLALARWSRRIDAAWTANVLGLNESLMATPSYSKSHLLFAVQACFSTASNQNNIVPVPSATERVLDDAEPVIKMAANCFNSAFEAAVLEYQERGRIFSPQNWLKANDSVLKIQAAVRMSLGMIQRFPGGEELKQSLVVPPDKFMQRWTAD